MDAFGCSRHLVWCCWELYLRHGALECSESWLWCFRLLCAPWRRKPAAHLTVHNALRPRPANPRLQCYPQGRSILAYELEALSQILQQQELRDRQREAQEQDVRGHVSSQSEAREQDPRVVSQRIPHVRYDTWAEVCTAGTFWLTRDGWVRQEECTIPPLPRTAPPN